MSARTSIVAASLAALLCLGAAPARAQDAETSSAYQELAQRATAAIAEARLDDALMLFRELHAMSPSARTLWSLGRVHFERGEYVLAHDHLRAALDDTERRPLDVAQRASATELLRTSGNLVAQVALTVTPPEAAVLVDGVQVRERALRLDAGSHELRFEAPGYEAATRRLELRGGEQSQLSVELTASGGGASVALLGALGRDPETPREVALEVRGEPGYRLLLRPAFSDDGAPFGAADAAYEAEAHGTAMTGVYRYAVVRADGAMAVSSQDLHIVGDTVLAIDYGDNAGLRLSGWLFGFLGVAGLVAAGVGIGLLETSMDPGERDAGTGLTVAGVVTASIFLFSFAFAAAGDEAIVRISPTWDAAGRL